MRERAREARPDVLLPLDVVRRDDARDTRDARDEWATGFERRIRDVASRAVAHIKRGDTVTVKTTTTEVARGDRTTGADRILRFLALLESVSVTELAERTATPAVTALAARPKPTLLAAKDEA